VEDDLVASRPVEVRTRFELAAARIADDWLSTGLVRVSRADFRATRDFLERDGWKVEEVLGVRVRLTHREVAEETTREGCVLVALRRLVAPTEGPRLAVRAVGARRAVPAPPPARRSVPVSPRVSGRGRTDGDACPAEWPA
jgi:hypothetical protein